MTTETHRQLADFIWKICNLLRGPYKRNEYRKVILPLTVLRRFDCLLAPTKKAVLEKYQEIKLYLTYPQIVEALMPKINRNTLNSLRMPVPPLPEQTAIAAYIDRETVKLDKLVEKVETAITRLQEYRTALITGAVTGKIDVRQETT